MHPTKTYIGKIAKGFNFLTYFIKPGVVLPSKEALRRFREKAVMLYEQAVPVRFKPKPERDTSEYHVAEPQPMDTDMTRVLLDIMRWGRLKDDKKKALYQYFLRWMNWMRQGLRDSQEFETSVKVYLPSLYACWMAKGLPDADIFNIIPA